MTLGLLACIGSCLKSTASCQTAWTMQQTAASIELAYSSSQFCGSVFSFTVIKVTHVHRYNVASCAVSISVCVRQPRSRLWHSPRMTNVRVYSFCCCSSHIFSELLHLLMYVLGLTCDCPCVYVCLQCYTGSANKRFRWSQSSNGSDPWVCARTALYCSQQTDNCCCGGTLPQGAYAYCA